MTNNGKARVANDDTVAVKECPVCGGGLLRRMAGCPRCGGCGLVTRDGRMLPCVAAALREEVWDGNDDSLDAATGR